MEDAVLTFKIGKLRDLEEKMFKRVEDVKEYLKNYEWNGEKAVDKLFNLPMKQVSQIADDYNHDDLEVADKDEYLRILGVGLKESFMDEEIAAIHEISGEMLRVEKEPHCFCIYDSMLLCSVMLLAESED